MTDTISTPRIGEDQAQTETGHAPRPNPGLSENSAEPETVSAIMVHSDPRRNAIAKTAVNNFIWQTYRNREIIIVNSSGRPITNREHPDVHEYPVDPQEFPTVGALRNYALHQASGEWICHWDDDDHGHPHRIAMQMAHRRPEHAVLLSHMVKVDVRNSVICVDEDPVGHPGSMLYPRAFAGDYQPDLNVGEDREFFERLFGNKRVLLRNDSSWFPGPCMLIGFWHGLNALPREEYLGVYAGRQYRNVQNVGVTKDILDYVGVALKKHNMQVEMRQAGGAEGPLQETNQP